MLTRCLLTTCLLLPAACAWAAPPLPAPVAEEGAQRTPDLRAPRSDLQAQVLLDRARFSPGQIDGVPGSNQRRAVAGFQKAHGLNPSGELDDATWQALERDSAPVLVEYTVTDADVAGPFVAVPARIAQQAGLPALGYRSIDEMLGERFHADPALLHALNPGADLTRAGTRLQVPAVGNAVPLPQAARIVVDKSDSAVRLLDDDGKVLAQFPASSGSRHDPLPIGQWKVQGVVRDPTFHYNPKLFWDANKGDKKATIAAGPNNPVGVVWVDLSKPHYGIHGTPEPGHVGKTESHGCVRLTNWDATTLADAVQAGTPVTMQE